MSTGTATPAGVARVDAALAVTGVEEMVARGESVEEELIERTSPAAAAGGVLSSRVTFADEGWWGW